MYIMENQNLKYLKCSTENIIYDSRLSEDKLLNMKPEEIIKYIISLNGYNEIVNVIHKNITKECN